MSGSVKGQVTFTIPVGELSSNRRIYIHADCYSAGRRQKGSIKIKEKVTGANEQEFPFGPEKGLYKDMLDATYDVRDDTFYEVTVRVENQPKGNGKGWRPSNVYNAASFRNENFHETLVVSEDDQLNDDVNDTIIRLIWFSRSMEA